MLPERFQRSSPWRRRDLLVLNGGVGIGLLVIAVAGIGASRSSELPTQVRWMNVGVTGVIVVGSSTIACLLSGRRAVAELRRHVLPEIVVRRGTESVESSSDETATLVWGAGMSRYHRSSCIFVMGKPLSEASEAVHRSNGRMPCSACIRESDRALP